MAASQGTLFGFKNPFSGMFSGSGFNPFKKPKLPDPDDPKYKVNGVWQGELFDRDMDDYEAQAAKISQFQEGVMGIGKEKEYKAPTHLTIGGARPAMQEISASPVGAPLNISLPGGNVAPGPSTPGTFGSMKDLMARADLLNQLQKKRIY
jgi:hypothetical protein